ncbi:hypothetical protein acsn021_04760 [Anaerocolumna cellulosilytica]|uniref:Uncharacterized protein n=2 Tax=Anaerocolumna cellulosilytica TaxID=433286 RepID=A0A6S6QYE8_9FIRM|nr:hypothetical protein acsn021_04760 [Anaerocolumna cellulosilytica]
MSLDISNYEFCELVKLQFINYWLDNRKRQVEVVVEKINKAEYGNKKAEAELPCVEHVVYRSVEEQSDLSRRT